ncbi:hypothetical protein BLNAU_3102 [Blattamonas nauphoetae]|uniref:Seryl-tRNA synthetase n=1 Tax=Blattamonas nauphoetae TaxID=2049346 RepID=A0ABQ9YEH1_9EUKA|nr:hypothetical protein BLNAU_3102 [Blattamonas nauphoetae]
MSQPKEIITLREELANAHVIMPPELLLKIRQEISNTENSIASHEATIATLRKEAVDLKQAGNTPGALAKVKEKAIAQKKLEKDRQRLEDLTQLLAQMGKESTPSEAAADENVSLSPELLLKIRRDIIFTECLIASHETIIANLTREALELHNTGNKAGAIVKLEGKKFSRSSLRWTETIFCNATPIFSLWIE